MRKIFFLYFITFCLSVIVLTDEARSQLISSDHYEIRVAPDLWYNTVDGIRTGIRIRGETPGTFLDGPHRLNAGLWLGTRFPASPVSYYISYTHPVPAFTRFNSEGAIRLMSSIRTGLHHHEAGIQKRLQAGFDEYVSTDIHLFAGFYRRFDNDYLLYESLWQNKSVLFLRSNLQKRDRNSLGRWTMNFTGIGGTTIGAGTDEHIGYDGSTEAIPEAMGIEGLFAQVDMEALQEIELPAGFYLRNRLFSGISSSGLPPEQRYLESDAAAFEWMWSGFTRARGTIPETWMRAGWIQLPGGPGLRGFTFRTTERLENEEPAWVQHAVTYSLDFYYPNPGNKFLSKIPYLGELIRLESYFFTDTGILYVNNSRRDLQSNAGAGFMFSLNIPDYLGQDRGFFLRYELPLWISEVPEGENQLKIRHLVGLGAQIRL